MKTISSDNGFIEPYFFENEAVGTDTLNGWRDFLYLELDGNELDNIYFKQAGAMGNETIDILRKNFHTWLSLEEVMAVGYLAASTFETT